MPDGLGWVGYITHVDGAEIGAVWDVHGEHTEHPDGDLCDVPKRVRLQTMIGGNPYGIEYDEGTGANPTIEVIE